MNKKRHQHDENWQRIDLQRKYKISV